MEFENIGYLEKQVALFFIFEPMLSAQANFLGYSGYAERLAWKASAKNFKGRNIRHLNLVDVSMRFFPVVGFVGDPAVPVPIT